MDGQESSVPIETASKMLWIVWAPFYRTALTSVKIIEALFWARRAGAWIEGITRKQIIR